MPGTFFVANFPTAADSPAPASGSSIVFSGFAGLSFSEQREDQLCWAAVCSAINRAAGRTPADQRDIVVKVFGNFVNASTSLGNAFYHLGLTPNAALSGAFRNDLVARALAARVPAAVTVRWDAEDGMGHALCVFGCRIANGSVSHVLVYDPWATNGKSDFVVEIPLSALPFYQEAGVANLRGRWAELLVAA